jgi:rare lipoprotein A
VSARVRAVALLVASLTLAGCAGTIAQDGTSPDARARALVRAGTAPPQRIAETPDAPSPSLSASDAALVRAGTLPVEGTSVAGPRVNALDAEHRDAPALDVLRGRASYYHDGLAGRPTATGEPYDPQAFTCAHRTLPFGTVLRVVLADDAARSVTVRVNDRGPFGDARRIVDLSRAAADQLGIVRRGVAEVRAEILVRGEGSSGRGRRRRRAPRRAAHPTTIRAAR